MLSIGCFFLIVEKQQDATIYFFSPDTHLESGGSRANSSVCGVAGKMWQGRGPQKVTTKTISTCSPPLVPQSLLAMQEQWPTPGLRSPNLHFNKICMLVAIQESSFVPFSR